MTIWCFARGRTYEQTLASLLEPGSREVSIPDAFSIFNPGDLLFISQSDGSDIEALGSVLEVGDSLITFAAPLRQIKTSGAKLWKAETHISFHAEELLPRELAFTSGTSVERSLGGTTYALHVAESASEFELHLKELTPRFVQVIETWIKSDLAFGALPFTLIEPNQPMLAVRLKATPIRRLDHAGGRCSIRLSLAIDAEDRYV